MGFGYKKNEDGIEIEKYWEFLDSNDEFDVVVKFKDG